MKQHSMEETTAGTETKMGVELVKVSVSGRHYDVPATLIERPIRQQTFKGAKYAGTGEILYYFPRHIGCFEAALDYLNHQELHMPQDVCPQVFIREMEFWGVDVNELKSCCKVKLDQFLEEMKALKKISKADTPSTVNHGTWRGFFHESLEEPQYSMFGQVYFWVAMLFVMLSIFVLCAETMPQFRAKLSKEEWMEYFGNDFHEYEDIIDLEEDLSMEEPLDKLNNSEYRRLLSEHQKKGKPLPHTFGSLNENIYYLSMVCGAFFTLDLIFRFAVFVNRKMFLFSLLNIVDAIAVLAFLAKEILVTTLPSLKYKESYIDAITAVGAIRVFRIFRLMEHSTGLRVFLFSLRAGVREIWLLFLFLAIGTLIFSSMLYFCERPNTVESIPDAFWWAVITMTTVGYGDVYPRTAAGKVLGSLCAVSGVLVMAVTVPIFASKFALYYHRVGRSRCVSGTRHKPFRRYSSFVKPMPEYGTHKSTET